MDDTDKDKSIIEKLADTVKGIAGTAADAASHILKRDDPALKADERAVAYMPLAADGLVSDPSLIAPAVNRPRRKRTAKTRAGTTARTGSTTAKRTTKPSTRKSAKRAAATTARKRTAKKSAASARKTATKTARRPAAKKTAKKSRAKGRRT